MLFKHFFTLCLVFLIGYSLFAAEPPQKPNGIFSELQVGQAINLKDEGTAYFLSYHEKKIVLSHMVVEIGSDFVVLEDVANVTSVRIPLFSIKGISVVKN